MKKKIAIVGSSGGNLFNLGGSDPANVLNEFLCQLRAGQMEIDSICFVAADGSMDRSTDDMQASLYIWSDGDITAAGAKEAVAAVNEAARAEDRRIAERIRARRIDGMILISSDPDGINAESVAAAAETGIPVVGSGGTSISKARMEGVRVIAASGTTGTTNRTRAVAMVSALAGEWKLRYMPVTSEKDTGSLKSILSRIRVSGVLTSCMPVFIAVSLGASLSGLIGGELLTDVSALLFRAVPMAVAAIAARMVSEMEEVGLLAGILAAVIGTDAGAAGGATINGLLLGIATGIAVYYLTVLLLRYRFMGTFANVCAICAASILIGIFGRLLLVPFGSVVTAGLLSALAFLLRRIPLIFGAAVGLLMWPCMMKGYYHLIILPLVMIEVGESGFSYFGAVDMVCLVMVSAGITLANTLQGDTPGEKRLAKHGFRANILFGTLIESSYPFIRSSRAAMFFTIAASVLSSCFVTAQGIRGMAYIPAFLAPLLCEGAKAGVYTASLLMAMALSFLGMLLSRKLSVRRKKEGGRSFDKNVRKVSP